MKIIKPGKIPEPKVYEFTCQRCNCIFECTEKECQEHQEDDGGYYFSWYMTYKCPTCGKTCYSKHY